MGGGFRDTSENKGSVCGIAAGPPINGSIKAIAIKSFDTMANLLCAGDVFDTGGIGRSLARGPVIAHRVGAQPQRDRADGQPDQGHTCDLGLQCR